MRMRAGIVCVFVLFAGACNAAETDPPTTTEVADTTTTTQAPVTESVTTTEPVSEFRGNVDRITTSVLVLQPEFVTDLGVGEMIGYEADYRLEDLSLDGRQEIADVAAQGLADLDALAATTLSSEEQLSVEILRWYLADIVVMSEYTLYDNPVNFITGAHANFSEFMADVHPVDTEQGAEMYVDRLSAFPQQLEDIGDRLEAAAEEGIVPADVSLGIARWQIQNGMGSGDSQQHPLVADLRARIEAMPDENASWATGVVSLAAANVESRIVPALEDLESSVRSIDGRSNQEAGVTYLPGGDDYYAAVLSHFLSADMTPEEVHAAGLEQVNRVVAELTVELDQLGYDASSDFVRAIRGAASDVGSMPTTSQLEREAVLQRAVDTIAEAESAFADAFTVRPESDLAVVRPRPGREGGSGAYYRSPPVDGSRDGLYYLSLGGSEFRVLTMDTTTYHEGVPGHHFQLAVQRALDEVPLHQRVFDFTGYAEGWALYAERLAYEAGLYEDDPLGNIGRLRMELLRASRMVVDTGIHWDGWSRNEAIEYMLGLGFDRGLTEAEVDRYIVWPGQAPAYMVGMLEILRLRDVAQETLGDDFDLTGFHDALLSQGSVPVALLQDVVDLWIESFE